MSAAEEDEEQEDSMELDDGVGTAHSRLEVQLRTLQDQLAWSREETEAAKKQTAEVQASLRRAEEQCLQLQRIGAHAEEVFSDEFEGRERVLEEELARLRATHTTTTKEHQRALAEAAAHLEEMERRLRDQFQAEIERRDQDVRDAETRATAAEAGTAVAMRELRALRESHNTELQRVAAEHDQAIGKLQDQLDEALARASAAQESAAAPPSDRTASAGSTAAKAWSPDSDSEEDGKADIESGAPISPPVPASPPRESPFFEDTPRARAPCAIDASASSGEVMDLRDRVQQLERRCCMLQKKLNQRPIVFQAPTQQTEEANSSSSSSGSGQGLWWEPRLRSVLNLGPHQATRVVRLLTTPDRVLRSFTQRLLKSDAWLRFFYLHLIVLYAIAASYYAQTTQDLATSPLDSFQHGGVVQQHASAQAVAAAVGTVGIGSSR